MFHFSADNIAEPLVLSDRITIPGSLCQYLKPHQLCAVRFLHAHYKKHEGCIYNDESGLGKCATAAVFLGAIGQDKKILIVVQNDDDIVTGWQFHLSLLSDLQVTVITEKTDCTSSEHSVYVAKWCTLKDIEDLSCFKFDFIVVDNRSQMLNNSFCLALLLKNYEKKVDIFISSSDVTLDLKLLHNVLRLCGCLEHQYINWKSFEEKFNLPNVRDVATKKIELEEYFVKREILVDFCKNFRLRQYRHQYSDILPLVDFSRYKNILETWRTQQTSNKEVAQSKELADIEVELLDLADDNNTEELFEEYVRNKKGKIFNEHILRIIQRQPKHLEGEPLDEMEEPFIMPPLVISYDTESEDEEVCPVENIETINLIESEELIDTRERLEQLNKDLSNGDGVDNVIDQDGNIEGVQSKDLRNGVIEADNSIAKTQFKDLNNVNIDTEIRDDIDRVECNDLRNGVIANGVMEENNAIEKRQFRYLSNGDIFDIEGVEPLRMQVKDNNESIKANEKASNCTYDSQINQENNKIDPKEKNGKIDGIEKILTKDVNKSFFVNRVDVKNEINLTKDNISRSCRKSVKPRKYDFIKALELRKNIRRRTELRSSVKQLRNRKLQVMKDIKITNRKTKYKKSERSDEDDKDLDDSDDNVIQIKENDKRSTSRIKTREVKKSSIKSNHDKEVSAIDSNCSIQVGAITSSKLAKNVVESKILNKEEFSSKLAKEVIENKVLNQGSHKPDKDILKNKVVNKDILSLTPAIQDIENTVINKEVSSRKPTRQDWLNKVKNLIATSPKLGKRDIKNEVLTKVVTSPNPAKEDLKNKINQADTSVKPDKEDLECKIVNNAAENSIPISVKNDKPFFESPARTTRAMAFRNYILEARKTRNNKLSENHIAAATSYQTPEKSIKNKEIGVQTPFHEEKQIVITPNRNGPSNDVNKITPNRNTSSNGVNESTPNQIKSTKSLDVQNTVQTLETAHKTDLATTPQTSSSKPCRNIYSNSTLNSSLETPNESTPIESLEVKKIEAIAKSPHTPIIEKILQLNSGRNSRRLHPRSIPCSPLYKANESTSKALEIEKTATTPKSDQKTELDTNLQATNSRTSRRRNSKSAPSFSLDANDESTPKKSLENEKPRRIPKSAQKTEHDKTAQTTNGRSTRRNNSKSFPTDVDDESTSKNSVEDKNTKGIPKSAQKSELDKTPQATNSRSSRSCNSKSFPIDVNNESTPKKSVEDEQTKEISISAKKTEHNKIHQTTSSRSSRRIHTKNTLSSSLEKEIVSIPKILLDIKKTTKTPDIDPNSDLAKTQTTSRLSHGVQSKSMSSSSLDKACENTSLKSLDIEKTAATPDRASKTANEITPLKSVDVKKQVETPDTAKKTDLANTPQTTCKKLSDSVPSKRTPNSSFNNEYEVTPLKSHDAKVETPDTVKKTDLAKTPQSTNNKSNCNSSSKRTPRSSYRYSHLPNESYPRALRSMQRITRAGHIKSKYMLSKSLDLEVKAKRKQRAVNRNKDNIENESLTESQSEKSGKSTRQTEPTEKSINEDKITSQTSVLPMSEDEELQCGQKLTPNYSSSSEQNATVAQKTDNFLIPPTPTPTLVRSIELPLTTTTVPDSELVIFPNQQHLTPEVIVLSSSQEEESVSSSSQSTQSRRTRALKNKEAFKKPLATSNKASTTDGKTATFSNILAEQKQSKAAKSPDIFSSCSDQLGISGSQIHNNKTTFEGFKIFGSEVKQFQHLFAAKEPETPQSSPRERSCLELLEKMLDGNRKIINKNEKKLPSPASALASASGSAAKKSCVNNAKSASVQNPTVVLKKMNQMNEKRPSPVDEDVIFEITNNCTFGNMIRVSGNGEASPVQSQAQKSRQSNKITNYLIGSSPIVVDEDDDAQLPRTPTKRPANASCSKDNVSSAKRSPKAKQCTQATKLTKWFSKQAAMKDDKSPTRDESQRNVKKLRRSPLKRRRLDLSFVK